MGSAEALKSMEQCRMGRSMERRSGGHGQRHGLKEHGAEACEQRQAGNMGAENMEQRHGCRDRQRSMGAEACLETWAAMQRAVQGMGCAEEQVQGMGAEACAWECLCVRRLPQRRRVAAAHRVTTDVFAMVCLYAGACISR
jgi:hypothetical protein